MQVSMREFKSHLSSYVTQAQSGELIELTSHRKVVARVIGIPTIDSAGISCLITSGIATWQGGKPIGAAFKLQDYGKSISVLVLENRG